MKTQNIAALLMENMKTVGVKFNDGSVEKVYTYKTVEELQLDDIVIVRPNGKFKFARVVELHAVPNIDVDSDIDYQWVVQKVDTTMFDQLNDAEKEFSQELLKIEHKSLIQKAKDLIIESLGISQKDLGQQINRLNNIGK